MPHRVLLLFALFTFVCLVNAPAQAADETVYEGTVVKSPLLTKKNEEKLVIETKDKKELTFLVAKDTKVTRDGKDGPDKGPKSFGFVKEGDKVKVTATGKGDKLTATKIEAKSK